MRINALARKLPASQTEILENVKKSLTALSIEHNAESTEDINDIEHVAEEVEVKPDPIPRNNPVPKVESQAIRDTPQPKTSPSKSESKPPRAREKTEKVSKSKINKPKKPKTPKSRVQEKSLWDKLLG